MTTISHSLLPYFSTITCYTVNNYIRPTTELNQTNYGSNSSSILYDGLFTMMEYYFFFFVVSAGFGSKFYSWFQEETKIRMPTLLQMKFQRK